MTDRQHKDELDSADHLDHGRQDNDEDISSPEGVYTKKSPALSAFYTVPATCDLDRLKSEGGRRRWQLHIRSPPPFLAFGGITSQPLYRCFLFFFQK